MKEINVSVPPALRVTFANGFAVKNGEGFFYALADVLNEDLRIGDGYSVTLPEKVSKDVLEKLLRAVVILREIESLQKRLDDLIE